MFGFKKKNLIKYRLEIEGMKCGMCESHLNNEIRKAFNVKKVTSSHLKKETIIYSEKEMDIEKIKLVVGATGYKLISIQKLDK